MLTLCCFNSKTSCNKRSVSCNVSDDVGSSMMMMREFSDSAFAISTICFSAMDNCSSGVRLEKFMPRRFKNGSVPA